MQTFNVSTLFIEAISLLILVFKLKWCNCFSIVYGKNPYGMLLLYFQHHDSERGRSSSRYGSTSRKAIINSKPSSSAGDQSHSDGRTSRLVSSSSRPSTTQRGHLGYEPKRSAAARGTRDDPLRSFELLSIRK